MSECILCKATIPDGTQYCENCYAKVKGKADESYLDGLLSSVTSSESNQDNANKRATKTRKEHKEEKSKNMKDDIFDGVPSDYNIFSKSDHDSDLDFLNDLFDNAIESTKPKNESDSNTLELDHLPEIAASKETDEVEQTEEEFVMPHYEVPPADDSSIEELPVEEVMDKAPSLEQMMANSEPVQEEPVQEEPVQEEPVQEESVQEEPVQEEPTLEQSSFTDSLLKELNLDGDNEEASSANQEEDSSQSVSAESGSNDNQSPDDISDSDQDILDLINEINSTEELPPVEDVTDYGEKLGNDYHNEQEQTTKNTSDIGDVFADALGAVSSLQDNEEEPFLDDSLLSMIPDISESKDAAGKEASKEDNKQEQLTKKHKKVKQKKHGVFSRIFGNIKEERTDEEIEQLKQQAIEEGEKKEAEKKAKEEEAKAKKEQEKLQKAENAQKAKEAATQKKQEKEKKAQAKKEEKAQRSKEIQELIDEIDENEGKINKVGAGIVFALFAAIAVVIVIGTNMYSYSLAIKHATNNFEIQHYNEAYKNVYGIDIKDEDIEIYDKIMTVMFVNKQLNSYENYYNMKKYPQALDSLLKGLERYDKYYSLAELLGIESDLDYVRSEILDKLDYTFDVSLEEANQLLSYDNQEEYSAALYDLLSERVQISADESSKQINN